MHSDAFSPYSPKTSHGHFYVPGGFYVAGHHLRTRPCERDYDVQPDLPAAPSAPQTTTRHRISRPSILRRICQLITSLYARWGGGNLRPEQTVAGVARQTVGS
jgi:hypothetical protein